MAIATPLPMLLVDPVTRATLPSRRAVTRAPSFSRAPLGCSLLGLGGACNGPGLEHRSWPAGSGLHDLALVLRHPRGVYPFLRILTRSRRTHHGTSVGLGQVGWRSPRLPCQSPCLRSTPSPGRLAGVTFVLGICTSSGEPWPPSLDRSLTCATRACAPANSACALPTARAARSRVGCSEAGASVGGPGSLTRLPRLVGIYGVDRDCCCCSGGAQPRVESKNVVTRVAADCRDLRLIDLASRMPASGRARARRLAARCKPPGQERA